MENKKENLVSIITPVYNSEKFIRDTIKSVQEQNYTNWELILINDCSTDNSRIVMEEYVNKDKRIKLLNLEKNSGVSNARNKGIEQAKGEYIAFLDSDDLWKKEKLEKQMNVIEKDDEVGLVYTASEFIDEESKKYDYVLNVPKVVTYKELLKQNIISCSSVLVKKEYVTKYKMEKDNMHEDFAVWLQILKDNVKAIGIDEPLLIYRISRNSKSGNKIKAAKMNLNVYKYMNLNFLQIIYYMTIYAYRGLNKYRNIKK